MPQQIDWKQEVADSVERVTERAGGLTKSKRKKLQNNFKDFAEYAFTDDDHNPIRQAPHHDHLQDLMSKHRRLVVLYPVGFGKTTQIGMRIVWELGRDPSLRIIVVSSKAAQSKKIVATIAREIAGNKKIQAVFPDLKPAKGQIRDAVENWSGQSLRVEGAPTGQKDPSVAAYGLDGSVSGSRADLIFGDNQMDFENTSSRHQRTKTIERFNKEVMTRLVPGSGRVVVTDTAWTNDDLPHELMRRKTWHSVVFDAEVNPFGDGVLWESRFPQEELENIRIDIGGLAYDLTYRNKAMSDSMGIFPADNITEAKGRCEWLTSYKGRNRIVTGVDLAVRAGQEHDLTVFVTVEDDGEVWRVVNIVSDRMAAGTILKTMVDIHKRFHYQSGVGVFVVEDNAAQDYIVQMAKDADTMRAHGATPDQIKSLNIIGRTTTAQKRDLEYGIPGIAHDLEMGRWAFPEHREIDELEREMLDWIPDLGHHSGDRLMALWQARSQLSKARPRVVRL